MIFNRNYYYTKDKFGNMIFNLTRCHSDMKMARTLVNNLNKGSYDSDEIKISFSLYITKLYFGHLKESLKLLNFIYNNEDYYSYFVNKNVSERMKKIINELTFSENSINKKYLDIRHDAFHYLIVDKKDVDAYIDANEKLISAGLDVVSIITVQDKYNFEVASDVLTLTKYFNCKEIPQEISDLYNEVLKILQAVLSNVYKMKKNSIDSQISS